MDIHQLSDFTRGWFIGDFEPSLLKTKDFEVGYAHHRKGDYWDAHYHKIAEEINYLVRGRIKIGDVIVEQGQIFHIHPGEITAPEFLEDSEILIVKVPSVKGDKYII